MEQQPAACFRTLHDSAYRLPRRWGAWLAPLASLVLLHVPLMASAATTATFSATLDTRVQQSTPTTAYGTGNLQTSLASNAQIESLVQFAVSGLPVGAVVTSATLKLYATVAVADGPAVYVTNNTWTAATTWNTRPASSGAALADLGAVSKNTTVSLAVTPAVTTNGTVSFLLRATATTTAQFNSMESSTNKPQLVVVYDTGPCAGMANGTACSDSNACTSGDTCQSAVCVGTAVNCDDANQCTTDTCSTSTGCVHAAYTGSCNLDGNACTPETCASGTCTAGGTINCDDGNPCTDDTCNTVSGCVHVNNTSPCTKDTNPCTMDVCAAGACTVGPLNACDDGNPCTLDSCVSSSGCVHTADSNCGGGTLIPWASTWRYLVTSTDQGSAWRATTFSDSAWASGSGPFGYGVTGLTTTIGYGTSATNKNITTYFRRTFAVSDPALYNAVTVSLKRDDACIVYVNGTEVARSNLPQGTVTWSTLAVEDSTGDQARAFYVPPALLVKGTNVLAVEIHQLAKNNATLLFDAELARKCPVAIGSAANQAVETLCDGLDNDCDGNTDLIVPNAQNTCTTAALGACGKGYWACTSAGKVCLTPPAVAESKNGIDDDCDGLTDEATASATKALKVRVLVPSHMWTDSPTYVQGVIEMLQAAGIPHYALTQSSPTASTDWYTGFDDLANYAVVLIPGYIIDETMAAWQMQRLTDYMNQGGIVVWWKPTGAATLAYAGLTSTTQIGTARTLAVSPSNAGALLLDAPEEREFVLSKDPSFSPVYLYTYGLDATSGATAWATAMDGVNSLGPTWVRKPVGTGALYTLGYDPLTYSWMRCYINCFDPGRDLLAVMIKAWLREGGQGHYGVKNAAPSSAPSVAVLSHDIDAPDSHNSGSEWGTAGALQMATMEKNKNVKGSFMITTDYVTGYNNANLPTGLCNLGQCPAGAHSVQHLNMTNLPLGDCSVTKTTYATGTPTVCGETVVNLQVLTGETPGGQQVKAWRSPYLGVSTYQFQVLASKGVLYDTSYAMGDTRTNFPLKADRWPYMDHVFHQQPLWELPIVQEDGMGDVVGGVTTRTELQRLNQTWFLNNWYNALKRNSDNGAWNVALVHPSYGLGVGPENQQWKIDTVSKYIDLIPSVGAQVDTLPVLADWWRARDGVALDVTWNPASGYAGTITVGSLPIANFSMEFADNIAAVSAAGAGTPTISGRRVVFPATLAANTAYTFTATVN